MYYNKIKYKPSLINKLNNWLGRTNKPVSTITQIQTYFFLLENASLILPNHK